MQSGSGFGDYNVLTPMEHAANRAGVEALDLRNEASRLAIGDARMASQVRSQAMRQSLIANAAALATTADDWDAAMSDLAGQGVTEARQYVGRYSEQLKGRIVSALSAQSPLGALAAMGGDSATGMVSPMALMGGGGGKGGGAVSGMFGAGDMDAVFAGHNTQQLGEIMQKLEGVEQAIQRVAQAQDPAAAWDKEAPGIGRPDLVGKYSPEKLQAAQNDIAPYLAYLRQARMRQQMGIPEVEPPAEVENVGGQLIGIQRHRSGAMPDVTPLTERANRFSLVGTDDEGRGIYVDASTGEERTGRLRLGAKPGGGGRGGAGGGAAGSVYEAKRQAWLEVHPGDLQGALEYAGALKGKELSADQAQRAAAIQAQKDLDALVLSNNAPPDAQAFLRQRAAEHFVDFTSSQEPPARTQPTGQGRGGYTTNQQQSMQRFRGSKAAPGTEGNPLVPTSQAQYDLLKPGTYYIHPDDPPGARPRKKK